MINGQLRSISFSKYLLERLLKAPELSLREIVEEAYASTLKPWHGWISSAAYKVLAEHLQCIPGDYNQISENFLFTDTLVC